MNANAKITVTISRVALKRTFSDQDIVITDGEGKSVLRAVLGKFPRLFDNVSYSPAYEMVSCLGEIAYFLGDLRHVRRAEVDMIT